MTDVGEVRAHLGAAIDLLNEVHALCLGAMEKSERAHNLIVAVTRGSNHGEVENVLRALEGMRPELGGVTGQVAYIEASLAQYMDML